MSPYVAEFIRCLDSIAIRRDLLEDCARAACIDCLRTVVTTLVDRCPEADATTLVRVLIEYMTLPFDEPDPDATVPSDAELMASIHDVLRGLTFCMGMVHQGKPEHARDYIERQAIPVLQRA